MPSSRVNRREFLALLAGTIAVPAKPFDSPLIARLAQDRPFDSPLIARLAQDRPFDSPLILSLSKGEPLAQDRPLPPVSWTCPMHPEVAGHQSGPGPICRIQLTAVRLDPGWSRQLHLDVT